MLDNEERQELFDELVALKKEISVEKSIMEEEYQKIKPLIGKKKQEVKKCEKKIKKLKKQKERNKKAVDRQIKNDSKVRRGMEARKFDRECYISMRLRDESSDKIDELEKRKREAQITKTFSDRYWEAYNRCQDLKSRYSEVCDLLFGERCLREELSEVLDGLGLIDEVRMSGVRMKKGQNGNFDIYVGEGEGHGHIVINKEKEVIFVRFPKKKEDKKKLERLVLACRKKVS